MDGNEYAKAREAEKQQQLVIDMIRDVIGLLNSTENNLKESGQNELADKLHTEGVRTLKEVITKIEYGF